MAEARPTGILVLTIANALAVFCAAASACLTALPKPHIWIQQVFPSEIWAWTVDPIIFGGPITIAIFASVAAILTATAIGLWRYDRIARFLELALLSLGAVVAGLNALVLTLVRSPAGFMLLCLAAVMVVALFYLLRPEVKELYGESPEPVSSTRLATVMVAIVLSALAGAVALFLFVAKALQGLR